MAVEIKVPSPGESISEVQLASWLVADGEYVDKDTDIADIDSDKATLTISAEESGKIKLMAEEGATIDVGSIIATIDTSAKGSKPRKTESAQAEKKPEEIKEVIPEVKKEVQKIISKDNIANDIHLSPLAKKMMQEKGIRSEDIINFYKNLRLSKSDVEFYLENIEQVSVKTSEHKPASEIWDGSRNTDSKKLSTLRLKLADRLVTVKNETAMLTTFNEVNMSPIMEIRKRYKEDFKEKYDISLGFMSFFTKAITEALAHFPAVNAMLDGSKVIYHKYADIGIAVSTPKGLMVPVLRNAEMMSLAEIELKIKELAIKARDGKITLDEMRGGTFTITNGGVFGSMLSTPIINPPQSAILGMHNIVERPIAVNGKVEIHPVMYVAVSYDHRIIDGRESVGFLVKVKEMLEDPIKLLYSGKDPVLSLLGL